MVIALWSLDPTWKSNLASGVWPSVNPHMVGESSVQLRLNEVWVSPVVDLNGFPSYRGHSHNLGRIYGLVKFRGSPLVICAPLPNLSTGDLISFKSPQTNQGRLVHGPMCWMRSGFLSFQLGRRWMRRRNLPSSSSSPSLALDSKVGLWEGHKTLKEGGMQQGLNGAGNKSETVCWNSDMKGQL